MSSALEIIYIWRHVKIDYVFMESFAVLEIISAVIEDGLLGDTFNVGKLLANM